MSNEILLLVGGNIRKARMTSPLTQYELAVKAAIAPHRLGQIESGIAGATVAELYSLKSALGVDLMDFYRLT